MLCWRHQPNRTETEAQMNAYNICTFLDSLASVCWRVAKVLATLLVVGAASIFLLIVILVMTGY